MAHSGPFVRGIYLTLHGFLPEAATVFSEGQVSTRYRESYARRPFVRMVDTPPELTHAVGTNYALMHATQSPDGRELQVSVAIDNLVKGAGGQAIQAMNLALGVDECAGLMSTGIFPC
jgi:N-acetyl-gamma-glutamyl-phosphate reductase